MRSVLCAAVSSVVNDCAVAGYESCPRGVNSRVIWWWWYVDLQVPSRYSTAEYFLLLQ